MGAFGFLQQQQKSTPAFTFFFFFFFFLGGGGSSRDKRPKILHFQRKWTLMRPLMCVRVGKGGVYILSYFPEITGNDEDLASSPLLHAGKDGLGESDGSEGIHTKCVFNLLSANAFGYPVDSDTCDVHLKYLKEKRWIFIVIFEIWKKKTHNI